MKLNPFAALSVLSMVLVAISSPSPATASIVSVLGPNSSAGTAPAIIAAPALVTNAAAINTGQQGFNEMQNVLLAAPLAVDGGFIAAGTRVSSQMIFLNKASGRGAPSRITHGRVTWTFDSIVLGTMSDVNGILEAASSSFLGAAGTTYPGSFNNRGLERNDGLAFAGNTATVFMRVRQPGDWVRVITQAAVPEPTTFLVWGGIGLCAMVGGRRRRTNP